MEKLSEPKNKVLIAKAAKNIKDILELSLKITPTSKTLVMYDNDYTLTQILTEGYKLALQEIYCTAEDNEVMNNKEDISIKNNNVNINYKFVDFNSLNKEEALAEFASLSPSDLVIMIQSTNFRLDDFRIRLHLFEKKLKVIEHMHLYRDTEDVWDVYIDSLEYNSEYLSSTSSSIKSKIDNAKRLIIRNNNDQESVLIVDGELEEAKLNIGDYTNMDNVGGTFPIGEVFTEAKDFSTMNGSLYIYALADDNFEVNMYEPFKINIVNGVVISYSDNAPDQFVKIYNEVKENESPIIREIGFGINKAITRERYIKDITAFERIYGMHISLGEKHTAYKRNTYSAKKTRYHVDLFPLITDVSVINKDTNEVKVIYEDGEYVV